MIPVRWIKVFKDLWSLKIRTLLVVLSIAVGVFAVGSVTSAYTILSHDMNADYLSGHPHSGYLVTNPFDDNVVASVRDVPGVEYAQGSSAWGGSIVMPGGKAVQVILYAIPRSGELKIDAIRTLDGSPLPDLRKNEILVDQASLPLLPVKPGDPLQLQLSDQRQREVSVAGIIHSPTAFASALSGQVTGYISLETYEALTGNTNYTQLMFTVTDRKTDTNYVKSVAAAISDKLEKGGTRVYATVVLTPGQHPAGSVTNSLLMLMAAMGGLTVFLSGFLVVNTISAVLAQQTRQIGVMKAVGGDTRQIVGMYVVLILCFGTLALLVGAPLAGLVSQQVVAGLGSFLNFEPSPFHIPTTTLVLEIIVALVVPLGAALLPVLSGARKTVREAISNYGIGGGAFGRGLLDRLVESIQGLPRPLLISLRNTFRRKSRLLLTLSTLTLAGAIFIAVFNLKAALDLTIAETLGYFLSDINLQLGQMRHLSQMQPLLMDVPGVERVEGWAVATGKILSPDKQTSTETMLWGIPGDSVLIQPVMISGRWIVPGDENAIVIGNHVLEVRPDLKVGDTITLLINNREFPFQIVGIFKMAGNVIPPFTYANADYVSKITNTPAQSAYYRLKLSTKTAAEESATADRIKALLKSQGIPVGQITTGSVARAQQAITTDILVYFLLFMAALIALVGGLGLGGTMSMNVIERTREIGIMRSIGASDFAILSMVVVEGMLIGIISWALGILLSIPMSRLLGNIVGVAFLKVPLKFIFSMDGFVLWLVIVVVLSAFASLVPAWNAARLTVRDVLAYE
jgi:putative ABC transport system permease protein